MIKSLILFFGLTVLSCQEIKAQSNFISGYILVTEQDTLFGEIDNKDYYSNSQFCDFRAMNSDSIIRYYPDKIYGYRFTNGKYYVSKNVDIDNKPVRLFLEYLVHGRLDIYFYLDDSQQSHYFAAKDSLPIEELKYSNKIEYVNGKLMQNESKGYVGLLTYYTFDCQSIVKEISKLDKLNKQKIIDFAEKYQKLTCQDEKCIIYEKRIPRKIKLIISGGVVGYFPNVDDSESSNALMQAYGFDILFQQSEKSEKVYLGIGLHSPNKIGTEISSKVEIPFSVNYINPKMGLSPIISYVFDLGSGFAAQSLSFGLNYQKKKNSIFLTAGFKTFAIIKPLGASLNFGIIFDLR